MTFIAALVIFPNNRGHSLFLEYLRTASNWPLCILIISILICARFYQAIDYKIRNLFVKTPKGYEIGNLPSQQTSDSLLNDKIKSMEISQQEKENFLLKIIKFERFIRLTFRSQFKLLKYLEGEPQLMDRAILFHWEYMQNSGNKSYPIQQYVGWLLNTAGFIELTQKEGKYFMALNREGKDFLTYCLDMNYSENTFIPL
jgi:hypothetical protein